MLGTVALLLALQGTPAMAACTGLARCLEALQAAAARMQNGIHPAACGAWRGRLLAFGSDAKHALLDQAASADPDVRDAAGCVLADWPSWTEGDLPGLRRAMRASPDGGWLARAWVHFPPSDAVPALAAVVDGEGALNQAGFTLARLLPEGVPDLLAFAASRADAERGQLAFVLDPRALLFDDDARFGATLTALARAANDPRHTMAERVFAVRMLMGAGERARPEGPSLRPLLATPAPALREAVRRALLRMRDPSMKDDVLASCPPPGSEPRGGDLPPDAPRAVGVVNELDAPACLDRLAGMGEEASGAAPPLVPYLRSVSWQWRAQTALTLGRLGNRSVAAKLHPLLADGDWQVVAAAILAEAQLRDMTALPLLDRLARRHWLYSVRRVARIAAMALRTGDPAALERSYRSRSPFGLLQANPLPTPASSCPIGVGSPLPMQVSLGGGDLSGSDRGEFGGDLRWRSPGQPSRVLLYLNVSGLFRLSDRTTWVVAGLAHMGFDRAALYRVHVDAAGEPQLSRLVNLPGAARERIATRRTLRLRNRAGAFVLVPGDPEGHTVAIHELGCSD